MNLKVDVGGLSLKNPLILGSSGITGSVSGMKKQIQNGYGAIVTKTCTPGALEGAPMPQVFWYDPDEKKLLSGAEALRNPGIDVICEGVRAIKETSLQNGVKIIGSCTANTLEEISELCGKFQDAGADAIELNMICPSTGPHLGPEYAQLAKWWASDVDRSAELISNVKRTVKIPVWAKINLEVMLSKSYLNALDSASPPDAYSFIGGRLPNLKIDIKTGKPVFPGNLHMRIAKKMPISPMVTGPVKPSTILHTAYFAKLTKTPLVCAGGLNKGGDILEAIMAGASAVQISAAVYRDAHCWKRILEEMERLMVENNYNDLESLRGIALESLPNPPLLTVPGARD